MRKKTRLLFTLFAASFIPIIILLRLLCTRYEFHGQTFDSAGIHIHYTIEGHGSPVVLIHGYCVNANINWRYPGIVHTLAKKHTVITLDLRGHGKSDKPHDPTQYGENTVEDIVRLLDHLNIPKAHIVGYSMGGYITAKFFTCHPDRVLTAAMCASGWLHPGIPIITTLTDIGQSMHTPHALTPLNRLLNPKGRSYEKLQSFVENTYVHRFNDPDALAAMASAFPALAITEDEFRTNKTPLLLIIGADDGLRSDAEALHKIISHSELHIIPHADHGSALYNRDLRNTLCHWLDTHSGDSPKNESQH